MTAAQRLLSGIVLAASLLAPAGARADHVDEDGSLVQTGKSILAQVHASSERTIAGKAHGGLQALDVNAATSWCPKQDDPHPELVITFPNPVALSSVEVFGGNERMPDLIELDAGDWNAELNFNEDTGWIGPYDFRGVAGRLVTRLVVRFPPASGRCLSELIVRLRDHPWVYGLEPKAVDALDSSVATLADALRSCDPDVLATLARFPVIFRNRDAGFADAEYFFSNEPTTKWANARELAKNCTFLLFNGRVPRVSQSTAPGVVRVLGGQVMSGVYWSLSWIKGRWQLVGAECAFFE
jgi:hypothetical protein